MCSKFSKVRRINRNKNQLLVLILLLLLKKGYLKVRICLKSHKQININSSKQFGIWLTSFRYSWSIWFTRKQISGQWSNIGLSIHVLGIQLSVSLAVVSCCLPWRSLVVALGSWVEASEGTAVHSLRVLILIINSFYSDYYFKYRLIFSIVWTSKYSRLLKSYSNLMQNSLFIVYLITFWD